MKRLFLSFTLFFTFLKGHAQEVKSNIGAEPKTGLEVTINGRKYQAFEGEELKLDSTLVKPSISIKLAEFKKFDNQSISFEYPKHFAFDFSQDFGYKNWTLTGNTLVVIMFEMDAKTGITAITDEMIKKFGKKNCKTEDFEKELGGKLFPGKKLTVKLVGQTLTLDCYEIALNDFKSRFIYFQDVIENAVNSAEYERGFKMINSTIKFKQ